MICKKKDKLITTTTIMKLQVTVYIWVFFSSYYFIQLSILVNIIIYQLLNDIIMINLTLSLCFFIFRIYLFLKDMK
jgi:hypothetical protein